MTFAVDRMNDIRSALEDRAAKLPATDPLGSRLRAGLAAADGMRKKIVATKEGGMITGEERLREHLTRLYGYVVAYDGRPSATEVAHADALARELADVVHDFEAWTQNDLTGLNSALAAKQVDPIPVLTREQWEARQR